MSNKGVKRSLDLIAVDNNSTSVDVGVDTAVNNAVESPKYKLAKKSNINDSGNLNGVNITASVGAVDDVPAIAIAAAINTQVTATFATAETKVAVDPVVIDKKETTKKPSEVRPPSQSDLGYDTSLEPDLTSRDKRLARLELIAELIKIWRNGKDKKKALYCQLFTLYRKMDAHELTSLDLLCDWQDNIITKQLNERAIALLEYPGAPAPAECAALIKYMKKTEYKDYSYYRANRFIEQFATDLEFLPNLIALGEIDFENKDYSARELKADPYYGDREETMRELKIIAADLPGVIQDMDPRSQDKKYLHEDQGDNIEQMSMVFMQNCVDMLETWLPKSRQLLGEELHNLTEQVFKGFETLLGKLYKRMDDGDLFQDLRCDRIGFD